MQQAIPASTPILQKIKHHIGADSIQYYYSSIFTQAFVGIFCGYFVERFFLLLQAIITIQELPMLLVQLFTNATVLMIIQKFISKQFAQNWQKTTSGLFFNIFYFGMQESMVERLRDYLI